MAADVFARFQRRFRRADAVRGGSKRSGGCVWPLCRESASVSCKLFMLFIWWSAVMADGVFARFQRRSRRVGAVRQRRKRSGNCVWPSCWSLGSASVRSKCFMFSIWRWATVAADVVARYQTRLRRAGAVHGRRKRSGVFGRCVWSLQASRVSDSCSLPGGESF